MSTRWITATTVILMALATLTLAACAKRAAPRMEAATPTPGATAARPTVSDAPRPTVGSVAVGGSATPPATTPVPGARTSLTRPLSTTPPPPSAFRAVDALQDIHFDLDRYDIRPEEHETLAANVRWLRLHPRALVLIEGHCDARGTTAYNLSLGDRRAKAIGAHLLTQGVAASRITTISYGEERPICTAEEEECRALNRRVHFLVKEQ